MKSISVAHILTVLLAMSAMLLLTSCREHYVPGPIDEEAKKEAEIYWASSFSKCGDSFYGVYSKTGRIVEFKSSTKYELRDGQVVECGGLCVRATHKMGVKTFTHADRLNGLEWVGKTDVDFSVFRVYESNGAWSEWSDYAGVVFIRSINIDMRKIQGRWQFGNAVKTPTGLGLSPVPKSLNDFPCLSFRSLLFFTRVALTLA